MERPRRKRLSWDSRCEIVARIEAGMSPPLAAASGGASRATGYRLWRRYQEGGWAALRDRPSTPRRQPRRLCAEAEQRILAARRRSAYGPVRLAGLVPHPPSTIGKLLRRHGCSRLPRPQGAARCARRYERERPRELLHIASKRLGRFWEPGKRVLGGQVGRPHKNRRAGWQHLHVAIDDHSRLAYAELLPGQDAETCVRFLERATRWYREQGVEIERVLTDNAKGLPLASLDRSQPPAPTRAPLHPRLPTTHQRQSRTTDPDPAPRVGLRPQLSLQQPTSPRPPQLHPLVQQPTTAQLARSTATHQPRLTPPWSRHLARHRGRLGRIDGIVGARRPRRRLSQLLLEVADLRRRRVEPRVRDLPGLDELERGLAEVGVGLVQLALLLDVLDALPGLGRGLLGRLLRLVEEAHVRTSYSRSLPTRPATPDSP